MIIVIQCAASKQQDAGHLITTDGITVDFVARPEAAPAKRGHVYARPDDPNDDGVSWRESLIRYNQNPRSNPLRLLPAYRLYRNVVYRRLVERFGLGSVYILSAGWGLIRADFLTPAYDITFSKSADRYKHRSRADRYADFNMLPSDTTEEIVFFGGKDYLELFFRLTQFVRARKIVFYNSIDVPKLGGFELRRFDTKSKTNWHYQCAQAFLNGTLKI